MSYLGFWATNSLAPDWWSFVGSPAPVYAESLWLMWNILWPLSLILMKSIGNKETLGSRSICFHGRLHSRERKRVDGVQRVRVCWEKGNGRGVKERECLSVHRREKGQGCGERQAENLAPKLSSRDRDQDEPGKTQGQSISRDFSWDLEGKWLSRQPKRDQITHISHKTVTKIL